MLKDENTSGGMDFETKMRKQVEVDSRRMSEYMDWMLVWK